MKRIILILAFLVPAFAYSQTVVVPDFIKSINDADRRAEMTVTKEGTVTLKNAKIMQFAGTTMYTRMIWGDLFLRVTVKTTPTTEVYRRYGEKTALAELKENDTLYIDGTLETGGNSFSVLATRIVDLDILKEAYSFTGIITGVNPALHSFVLRTKSAGDITIQTHASTSMQQGSRAISTAWLKSGDKVLSVVGEYNHATKTLTASRAVIHVDLEQFKPKNYAGTLLSVTSSELFKVRIGNKVYDVALTPQTKLLNKKKNTALIKRFVEGDELVLYGATSENATTTITAEIIRNLSL